MIYHIESPCHMILGHNNAAIMAGGSHGSWRGARESRCGCIGVGTPLKSPLYNILTISVPRYMHTYTRLICTYGNTPHQHAIQRERPPRPPRATCRQSCPCRVTCVKMARGSAAHLLLLPAAYEAAWRCFFSKYSSAALPPTPQNYKLCNKACNNKVLL